MKGSGGSEKTAEERSEKIHHLSVERKKRKGGKG